MATLLWKDSYRLGVDEVDKQHRHMFDLLSRLQDSIGKPDSDRLVGETLKDLVEHARVHFRDEERLMEEVGYHDIARHRALHKTYLERIAAILRRLKAGQQVTVTDLISFLERWLVEHLLGEDIKIAFAVRARLEKVGER